MTIKKNKKNKRITTVVVVLLLLAAVIAASVIGSRGDLPEVKTARVDRRSLIESKVTANGEVRPIQFTNLTAEVSGRVTDIFVKVGDQVTEDAEHFDHADSHGSGGRRVGGRAGAAGHAFESLLGLASHRIETGQAGRLR